MAVNWIDLLDPTEEDLHDKVPFELQETAIARLLAKPVHDDEPRPTIKSHGTYVFGVFVVAISMSEENELCYQEIELLVAAGTIVTVRKTPPHGRAPYELDDVRATVRDTDSAGMIAYRIIDDIAEKYLDLVDAIDAERFLAAEEGHGGSAATAPHPEPAEV